MKYVIATDGDVGERAARLLRRLVGEGDMIEVLTVVEVPRRFAAGIRPARAYASSPPESSATFSAAPVGHEIGERIDSDASWPGDAELVEGRVREESAGRQRTLIRELRRLGLRVRATSLAGDRVAAAVLDHCAETGADVLVIGRGSSLRPGALGPVAQRLARDADCPVVIVPG